MRFNEIFGKYWGENIFNGLVKVYLQGAIIRTLYDVVETEMKLNRRKHVACHFTWILKTKILLDIQSNFFIQTLNINT